MPSRLQPFLIASAIALGFFIAGCPYVRVRALDEARVETLRAEIDAIIATGTCSLDADCSVVALGDECGPVSEYLPYAPATVDLNALNDRIGEYNDLRQILLREGICALIEPPVPMLRCESSVCVAGSPAGQ
jgi:hypothetical protein